MQLTDHLKIDVSRDTGLGWKTCGEIPACKVERGTNDEIWDLREGLRANEGAPVVGFGLKLSQS